MPSSRRESRSRWSHGNGIAHCPIARPHTREAGRRVLYKLWAMCMKCPQQRWTMLDNVVVAVPPLTACPIAFKDRHRALSAVGLIISPPFDAPGADPARGQLAGPSAREAWLL